MPGAPVPADDSAVYSADSKRNIYERKWHFGHSEDWNCVRGRLAWKGSDMLSIWNNDPACVLA